MFWSKYLLGIQPIRIIRNKDGGFTEINAKRILSTLKQLEARILERFPESGLSKVCGEFILLVEDCEALAARLSHPLWPIRLLTVIGIIFLILIGFSFLNILIAEFQPGIGTAVDLIQATESVLNELIFVGLSLFFLVSIEIRFKRHYALKALHRLRSVAHVVDMHQLTKDPAQILSPVKPTKSSPVRQLNRDELMRYLDYCAEMLAINSKIAALFAQNLDDTVILHSVNELESLNQGLSEKIWQKIMILELSNGKKNKA